MFLKYFIGLIPPKKSRGKWSQGKKTADVSQETVDVSNKSEPEPVKKKTGSRSTRGVVIQDTPSAPKPKLAASKLKLKEAQVKERVEYQGFLMSEGTGTKPRVPDEEKVTLEENVILEWGSEHKSKHLEDSQLIYDEEEKRDNDGDADDEDEDVDHTAKEKGDAELAGNAMASNYQVKESTEFPLPSTSLSVLSRFVTPTISIVQQTITTIPTPPITIDAPTITTAIPESNALTAIWLRVTKLENDMSELKNIDHFAEALATLKSQVLTVFEHYLGSKIGYDLQKVLKRHTAYLIQKYSVKLESSKIQTPTVDPKQESEKSALEIHKVKKELAEKQKMPKYTITSTEKATLKEELLIQSRTTKDDMMMMRMMMKTLLLDQTRVEMDDAVNTTVEHVVHDANQPHDNSTKGHLTVATEHFFNNDLEFLKSFDPEKKYTTSITKTKAARYEIVRIEDITPMLWSTIQHGVKKLHGYGHLEEIVVKRADRQLYKFKEGNFVDLHLNNIEDMLLLAVQHKLFHLNDIDIVDFIVALCMFTRSLIIKIRVEYLQLGVDSYQKKLNITEPQKTFPEIEFKELYTPSYKPPGQGDVKKKVDGYRQKDVKAYGTRDRLQTDDSYCMIVRTLNTVRNELHHRILNFRLGYSKVMSRRKWTATDKRMSKLMVELINKQMREKRIIQNLERLVGAQELEIDYKLMTRIV
nr:hypothetical protein [Tanacetum cinerariifolium]